MIKMNLREEILNALVDDIETIVQIRQQLKHFKVVADLNDIKRQLNDLYINGFIKVVYPENFNLKELNVLDNIDDLWFDLTEKGKLEWDKIEV